MPTIKQLHLSRKNVCSGEVVETATIDAEFSDAELSLLTQYKDQASELRRCGLVAKGLPTLLQAKFESGSNGAVVQFKFTPFDWNDVHAALHLARPMILTNEPASFDRVRGLIAKRIEIPSVRERLAQLLLVYTEGRLKPFFQMEASGSDLFSDATFATWLNASQYHRDQKKRESFERVEATLGKPSADGFMLAHFSAKIEASIALASEFVEPLLPHIR